MQNDIKSMVGITGPSRRESTVIGGFPSQRASDAEIAFMSWRLRDAWENQISEFVWGILYSVIKSWMWCEILFQCLKSQLAYIVPSLMSTPIYFTHSHDTKCYPTDTFAGCWFFVLRFISPCWDNMICCNMIWYDMIWYDMIWYDMIWYDMMWCDVMWCDVMWRDVLWHDMTWHDMRSDQIRSDQIRFILSRVLYNKWH